MRTRKLSVIPLLIILCLSFKSIGQYQNFQIKEHYDLLYSGTYQSGKYSYDNYHTFHPFRQDDGSWKSNGAGTYLSAYWTTALESLLRMYETTEDKAYLYAFMKEATKIIRTRRDLFSSSYTNPLWFRRLDSSGGVDESGNNVSAAFNGRILMALSHFVYIIKKDYDLRFTSIEVLPSEDRQVLYNGSLTFEEYVNWVELRVDETLTWATNNMWKFNPNTNGSGIGHSFVNARLGEFNFQTPWAISCLYMYLSDNSTYYHYGARAVNVAQLILGPGDNDVGYASLFLDTNDNSYWWLHDPWKSDGEIKNDDYLEDIGHANLDILFPQLYNKHRDRIYNHITTTDYFADYHLIRFRNTFLYNIYDEVDDGFHMGVDGTSLGSSGLPLYNQWNTYPFDYEEKRFAVMNHMPFTKFDSQAGDGKSVYNVLMNFYDTFFKYESDLDKPRSSNGFALIGLSNLVKEQWENECYSLRLNNRVCYFDQKFYAKDTLYVGFPDDGSSAGGNLNYYPINSIGNSSYTQESFIVKSGVNIEFKAGTAVVFGPNYVVEPGANVSVIEEGYFNCIGGISPLPSKKSLNEPLNEIDNLEIYPNPISENSKLVIHSDSTFNNFRIYDRIGNEVVKIKCDESKKFEWLFQSKLKPGMYYVNVFKDDLSIGVKKLMVQ